MAFQSRARPKSNSFCPRCGKLFNLESSVLNHMNQRSSNCRTYFVEVMTSQLPNQHAEIEPAPSSPASPTSSIQPFQPLEAFQEDQIDVIPDPEHLETVTNTGPYYTEFHPQGSQQQLISRGSTFMELFNGDKNATKRVTNLYFPFSSQEEWQLGAFLVNSGLSMSEISEFLKLELVSTFIIYRIIVSLTLFHRSNA